MDFRAAKARPLQKRSWARTGALILFLITAVLLVASLHDARSQPMKGAFGTGAIDHQN